MVQDFEGGFFEYLQREERATWTLLKIVGKDGLVYRSRDRCGDGDQPITADLSAIARDSHHLDQPVGRGATKCQRCVSIIDKQRRRKIVTDSVHNPPSAEQVRAIFNQLTKPKLKWTINALNLLRKIESDEDGIRVTVALITDDREEREAFWEEAEVAIKRLGIKKAGWYSNG